MNRLLALASLRALRHHPWQLALALLGIALGVGMVVAVQLTQESARQALVEAQRALAGEATDRISPVHGLLDEQSYVALRQALPDLPAAPMLKGAITLVPAAQGFLQVLGIDPLSTLGARALAERAPGIDLGQFIGTAATAVLSADAAERLGLQPGAVLRVQAGDRPQGLTIIGILPASAGLNDSLLVDLATAQELLGQTGRLSGIELKLPTGAQAQRLRDTIRRLLPADARLREVEAQVAASQQMTRAFDLNLTALSLLALLVGMFLIYNTETFLILQRQAQFARLRALGVSARELLLLLLGEAALLGAIGSGAGVLLGEAIARGLLGLVAQTVNDLYAHTAITTVVSAPGLRLAVWILGVLATVLAAAPPVLSACRLAVRRTLTAAPDADHGHTLPLALAGIACAGTAGLLLCWSTRSLFSGFAILILTLTSGCLFLPTVLTVLARHLSNRLSVAARPGFALGIRAVSRRSGRQALAATALMAATATAMAMSLMIGSFRQSVDQWLAQLLKADVYVNKIEKDQFQPDTLEVVRERLGLVPGVANTSSVSRVPQMLSDGQDAQIMVYELPPRAQQGFHLLAGAPSALWAAWEDEDVVMVSEPWAWRQGLAPGATVTLAGPDGPVNFRIAAVYQDYASERGSLAMSRRSYLRHFPAPPLDGIGIYRHAQASADETERAIRAALASLPVNLVRQADVRRQSMAIFDRTFAVTEVLRVVALGVAVIGIVAALLAQQFERLREYGVLRALGFSSGAIVETVFAQTLLIGVVAATCALPLGTVLAVVLIEVINLRSFGWTMTLSLPVGELAATWALAVGAALLAGIWPALRVRRMAPAAVLREE